MIVYVEKKVLEDPALLSDDHFGPVKRKFCTFREGKLSLGGKVLPPTRRDLWYPCLAPCPAVGVLDVSCVFQITMTSPIRSTSSSAWGVTGPSYTLPPSSR